MTILDASALIALLEEEPGHAAVADAIAEGAGVCSANLAETVTALLAKGVDVDRVPQVVLAVPLRVFDVTRELAISAGLMFPVTRRFGLSLGDRLCLALAAREGQPAMTSDRIWRDAGPLIGVDVRLIR